MGNLRTYHDDQPMRFEPEFLDELTALETYIVTNPERYLLVAAKGDELLDWREMIAKYPDVPTQLIEGSDHGLSDFADYIDQVLAFAGFGAS